MTVCTGLAFCIAVGTFKALTHTLKHSMELEGGQTRFFQDDRASLKGAAEAVTLISASLYFTIWLPS